jgi:iron transport multicopper oxidase
MPRATDFGDRTEAAARTPLRWLLVALAAALVLTLALGGQARASGVTNSGDDLRDGWYPEQTSLTPQLVSGGTFGKMWSANVEGQVYAQPLLANGTLLVATENDKAYGLDPSSGALNWTTNLGTPWRAADIGCGDLMPNIGVTATPVIDAATNTAYLTHKTYASGTSGPARWYMDALNLSNGSERTGFPVELAGTAQNQSSMTFQPTTQMQRPGLLLMNGVVYAAFGSHCDISPWQGWVFGVSTAGQVKARWVSRVGGNGAGIWQSGSGIFSDGNNTLVVATGNGGAPSTPAAGTNPPANLGESVIRLAVQADGSLRAVNFFAPFDASQLDTWDADFASGGVTGLNEQYFGTAKAKRLAVAVGKDGYVYLLNRDELGGFKQGSGGGDNVVQRIGPYGGVWSRPAVWPGDGGWVYIPTASGGKSAGGSSGFLNVYQYGVSGTGLPTLSLQASSPDAFGFGTSAPIVTSNGTASGSALVWTVWMPNGAGGGAQLRAYDPLPVNGQPVLRFSAPVGTASKFAMPGVGAGRIYVGNREGKVLAFGSPVTPPLSGPSTSFPTTNVGSSSQKTLTLTANTALTITKITSNSSQFEAGAPTPPLPATLGAGQTIQVPLTFKPAQTGLVGGTLEVETSKGASSFSMSGTGQSETAQLEASPKVLSFGGTSVGNKVSGTATFRNSGGAPLTINKVIEPSAPFSASGVPSPGTKIEPGGALTVNLTFEPSAEGNFAGEITLETSAGNGTVALSGSAGKPGVLKLSSESVDFGAPNVGGNAVKTFTITNTGGTTVTITKSKPPSGGAFAATSSLPEGTTVAPNETLTESVTFSPAAAGYAAATWAINGDDTTGLHEVKLGGIGNVPAPGAAWSHNGSATISSEGVVQTTPAKPELAGSAFFTAPLESRHLTVQFDQTIGGGNVGADGQTVTFADATKATPASLGYKGGGLGFSGITGIAVAFDTYKNSVNPSNNFVGITNGPGSAKDLMHWLATATAIPGLRSAVRHIKVEALNGTVTVWIDGAQVLSAAVALPPKVLLGFTGATGGYTDTHQAAKVVVSGDQPPSEPQPASLKLTMAVNAPAGSPQAATQFALSGSCPSSFTAGPLGNGGSATPTLTGAVSGASCAVSQAAPSESGWKTTASVNGGPPVELAPSGGQLTVPSFALAPGVNTVALTNTYTPSGGSLIPDPSAGGWQLNGAAALEGASLVLTPATSKVAGSAFWPTARDPRNLSIEFDISIGGGSGADGLALVFADVSKGAKPTSLGEIAGGLGFGGGIPGIAQAFDTFKNSANPSSNFVGISNGAAGKGLLHWLGTANVSPPLRNTPHHVKVSTAGGAIALWLDGTKIGQLSLTLPSQAYIGFSAATGELNDRHAISKLNVTAG